eukprot:scaffold631_cov378-Prasinococcus_capsulatus_cf.AAC.19
MSSGRARTHNGGSYDGEQCRRSATAHALRGPRTTRHSRLCATAPTGRESDGHDLAAAKSSTTSVQPSLRTNEAPPLQASEQASKRASKRAINQVRAAAAAASAEWRRVAERGACASAGVRACVSECAAARTNNLFRISPLPSLLPERRSRGSSRDSRGRKRAGGRAHGHGLRGAAGETGPRVAAPGPSAPPRRRGSRAD